MQIGPGLKNSLSLDLLCENFTKLEKPQVECLSNLLMCSILEVDILVNTNLLKKTFKKQMVIFVIFLIDSVSVYYFLHSVRKFDKKCLYILCYGNHEYFLFWMNLNKSHNKNHQCILKLFS